VTPGGESGQVICPKCGHHLLLHNEEGCEMRTMQSGYPDFASLPKCGCNYYAKGEPSEKLG